MQDLCDVWRIKGIMSLWVKAYGRATVRAPCVSSLAWLTGSKVVLVGAAFGSVADPIVDVDAVLVAV
eukprot:m51a1_g12128 hypothetical protein (67) ;mRNA; f:3966-4660